MKRKQPSTHVWSQVRAFFWCAMGEHNVPGGRWMRFRRGDHRGLANCEACLAEKGIFRTGAADPDVDGRALRAGIEE